MDEEFGVSDLVSEVMRPGQVCMDCFYSNIVSHCGGSLIKERARDLI